MRFQALGNGENVSFDEALQNGIASDGSLYFPSTFPQIDRQILPDIDSLERKELAMHILAPWVLDEMTVVDLQKIVDTASTFDTPIVDVGDKKVLELSHGPTMAFKDVAARYLAAFMGHYNQERGESSTVLVATSGDTGGAIAHGFADVEGTQVVVLYPKGRVSSMQQEQLRRTAGNVRTLEVDGVFDDCQDLVKEAFVDQELSGLHLTSANSISIGRLLPQMTYYADAYRQISEPHDGIALDFVVPTGNLGNITAGMFARRMGVPIRSFTAANNANDALSRYLGEGNYRYDPSDAVETISNAMDVGRPNNFPRFLKLIQQEPGFYEFPFVSGVTIDDAETANTIKRVYEEHGYLLDPHTAVAWAASDRMPKTDKATEVIVSTAAPQKFAEEIEEATGIEVDNSAALRDLRNAADEEYTEIANDYSRFKDFLKTAL